MPAAHPADLDGLAAVVIADPDDEAARLRMAAALKAGGRHGEARLVASAAGPAIARYAAESGAGLVPVLGAMLTDSRAFRVVIDRSILAVLLTLQRSLDAADRGLILAGRPGVPPEITDALVASAFAASAAVHAAGPLQGLVRTNVPPT